MMSDYKKQDSTGVFVASVTREEIGFKWLTIINDEWVTTPWLAQAKTYPIVQDLLDDLRKSNVENYNIHMVKMDVINTL